MTRKDYRLIAEALNEAYQQDDVVSAEGILESLVWRLYANNHNFDSQKFRRAVLGEK